jgi:hypothetical protein
MELNAIRGLDDNTALRILSALTADLMDDVGEPPKIGTMEDARDALGAFLSEAGVSRPADLDHLGGDAARELLILLAEDPMTADRIRALVAAPPDDEQRSVELALGAAVILGALVTWLQTKFEIEIKHEDGQTSFHFSARKNPTGTALIKDVAKSVMKIF